MIDTLVLASNNRGKLAELQAMFAPLGVKLVCQADLGIGEADEPHRTFVENALAKARHAARESGLPALADDAGLCVDAFGGLPGVDTAFYATQLAIPRATTTTCGPCSSRCRGSRTGAPRWSARWWPCAAPTTPSP